MDPGAFRLEILEQKQSIEGASLGARVRRWWWNVNNWDIPGDGHEKKRTSENIKEVRALIEPSTWD